MVKETPARRTCPVDVFAYLDYRAFLADFYKAKKRRGFSYRAFSRDAGLGAPNYLKLVIAGDRNLTPPMAARFAAACGLSGEAAEYFQELVVFGQARKMQARNASHLRLSAYRRYRQAHRLELAQAAYHATWYLPAIRELVASGGFLEDPQWIAATLLPPIKAHEAKQALDTLLELGLLVRDDKGRLQQHASIVSTGPETLSMNITNYHAEMMRRATAAMELAVAAERDVSSLTFCLGPDGIARFKKRVQEFRRELLELAEQESERTQVVQLNMQLFPLSTTKPRPLRARRGALR